MVNVVYLDIIFKNKNNFTKPERITL